jgi:hypothetical protein
MATFSIGDALGSGFKVIGKRPLSVLAWGLAYLLLALLPMWAVIVWIAPDFFDVFHDAIAQGRVGRAAAATAELPPGFMQMQAKMMMLQPVMLLSTIVGRTVLMAAVFRAVLEPQNRSFAGLRLGAQELWLALLNLAAGILAVILILVIAVAGALVGLGLGAALRAANVDTPWLVLCEVAVGVVAVAVLLWVVLRFSLAGPMTFADREFRLFESWPVTKGQTLKLFGLVLLLILLMFAVEMVVGGVFFAVVLAGVGGSLASFDHAHMQAFFMRPPQVWLQTLWPWIAVLAVVGSFLLAAVSAIFLAPWADVYRQLTSSRSTTPLAFAAEEAAPVAHAEPAAPPAPPPESHDQGGHDDHGHAGDGHHADEGHGDAHGDDQDHHKP